MSIENSSIIQRSGILNTIMLFCSVLLIAIIYSETFISIKDLWDSSDTYAHGYIILPISFYLIWNKRDELDQIPPSISFLGLALVICCVIMWFLSSLVEVQILKQYSVVAMIPLMFVLFWGWQRTRIIIFPLLFILLSVPFGEAYVPYMIKWVGDFVFVALQLTGIPVFREGNMLFLTSGDWSVVEACSGLRYLIASITLGLLYAYLMYRSFWRRTLFIILSVAVPVFANWIRAYMIIMIGHLSSMKLAVGVDHIVYGWLFFGLVIGLMFYIGTFWREDIAEESKTSVHVSIANGSKDSIKLILAIIVLI
ncbi:MAG: exosortase A, partial [Gammaproteobacteria bacterium]|nr:exosortase A [Gammaproteobacteria bacterium]